MLDNVKPCDYTIDFPEIVHSLAFAKFDWENQLLAIGGDKHVTIGTCKFKEDVSDGEGMVYTELLRFQHSARVTDISWSMQTSLVTIPKIVKFATAASDYIVRVITSDLKGQDRWQEFIGHSSYVNAVSFDVHKGENCASVGDDQTCRVWSPQGEQLVCFTLGSPGMSVNWHPDEPNKLLVALKNGVIRIYSLHTHQPIMSFDCGSSPLLSADWSIHDCVSVAVVTTTQCFIFDTSRSSRPMNSLQSPNDGFRAVKWCRCRDNLLATTGRPGQPMKVFNLSHSQVTVTGAMQISNGITWHHRLPVLAVGGDKAVHMWVIGNI